MGQVGSLPCCCWNRERRANTIINETLQEKLLEKEEQTHFSATYDETVATDVDRPIRHESSNQRGASGMMPLGVDSEEDDGVDRHDRMDEEEDDGETDRPRDPKLNRPKKQVSSSYHGNTNVWDLPEDGAFGLESASVPLGLMISNESIRFDNMTLPRIVSDESRDSYASNREITKEMQDEKTDEEDNDEDEADEVGSKEAAIQDAVLRRRSLPHATSTQVFDDDLDVACVSSQGSTSSGLRELAEHDGESDDFNSFGSNSSSMRSSLLSRYSDIDSSGLPLVESMRLSDGTTTTEGDADEIRPLKSNGNRNPQQNKKKSKKRR